MASALGPLPSPYARGAMGWDGSIRGAKPLKNVGEGVFELTGLPNGVLVYVAVSAENAQGERSYSPFAKAQPERKLGERVWIPAGGFPMGRMEEGASKGEAPERWVYTDGFWMDQYVATNDEYRVCVDAGVCGLPAQDWGYLPGLTWIPDYFSNPLYGDHPVSFLQYQEASDYCGWRGMRLPTEAEWEKAARGTSPDPGFPWGNDPPTCEVANYSEDGQFCEGGPLPVDSFPANISPYGVREMGGNVWEWTGDWFDPSYYEWGTCVNPTGPETGSVRVLRGGAWYYPVEALSVTYRNTWEPTFLFVGNLFGDYRGFGVRCVEAAPEMPCEGKPSSCDLSTFCAEPLGESPLDGEVEDTEIADAGGDSELSDVQEPREMDTRMSADGEWDSESSESEEDSFSPDAGKDGEDPQEVEESDGEAEPCIHPQDLPVNNEFLCFDPIPGLCPSGWAAGCEVKACHCSIGKTAEPGECGQELMTVTAGWRDKEKVFTAFSPDEAMEVCEGFRRGSFGSRLSCRRPPDGWRILLCRRGRDLADWYHNRGEF